ncbi:hypothetical protein [Streptomyces sp. NBC_00996]|uniref:hypothetical protein n=1 Tax=Streptomyces sp. NBC_00996 TaxID=2903710 RepID=UPI0038640F81|nr:hypothetical protein OG390_40900 [Streptomyces sp. NBC_00996]
MFTPVAAQLSTSSRSPLAADGRGGGWRVLLVEGGDVGGDPTRDLHQLPVPSRQAQECLGAPEGDARWSG